MAQPGRDGSRRVLMPVVVSTIVVVVDVVGRLTVPNGRRHTERLSRPSLLRICRNKSYAGEHAPTTIRGPADFGSR
jgi:hypothetical protein